MSDDRSTGARPSGLPSLGLARILLALLCLLSAVSGPSPVLCLERDGSCNTGPAEAPGPASCHDETVPGAAACESCTDVATPEESLASAGHPGRDQEAPVMASAVERAPLHVPAPGLRPRDLSRLRPDPTSALVRTTVLLI